MQQLLGTLVLLAPFLVAALGISGYLFAGQALGPTKASLGVLRRFVADAGHEFTTPVAVILASLETLEQKLPKNGPESEILSVIARATERMASLAKDLVFLARMESPHTQSLSRVKVNEVIVAVVEEFLPLATEKNVKLIAQDIQQSYIMGHEESVRTLVSNLIKNAITYTESGGTVSVSLEKLGSQIQIIVDDTGIGIPAESLSRIFERFYRVDKSRSRSGGGSGLGLAIVKAIVDGHNGSIKVESFPVRGTRFTVTLPVRAHLSPESV
jgi:two-component system OmpR family sensor kinase